MKKLIVLLLALTSGATLLTGCADSKTEGNYSDEMKIPYSCDLSPDDGADSVERLGDHKNSPDVYKRQPQVVRKSREWTDMLSE